MPTTDNPRKAMVIFTQAVGKTVSRLALNITQDLIEQTPVDTGWARANWVPSVGEEPKVVDGSPEDVSVAQQQKGVLELFTYPNSNAVGQPVFIVNNVPYIGALNDGHSQQAPAGFVDAIVHSRVLEAQAGGDLV